MPLVVQKDNIIIYYFICIASLGMNIRLILYSIKETYSTDQIKNFESLYM